MPKGVYVRTEYHNEISRKNSPFRKGNKLGKKFKNGHHIGRKRKLEKTNTQGYVLLYIPQHPFCDKEGHIRRNRLVMEQKIDRYLKPKEVVHHINGIPSDDRPENLKLFPTKSAHTRFHNPKKSS